MPALILLLAALASVAPRQEGAPWYELRGGLDNSLTAFSAAGEGRVVFLGGSITFNPGWRDQVAEFLDARFPEATLTFVNAGVPSMGSTPGAFRLADDALSGGPVDLLFVEAAVNDSTNGRSPVEMLRGMEGIVRHARHENPFVDVVLMHFVDPDKMAAIRAGQRPKVIAVHERVAEHYELPSLDLASEVTARIDAGEFTWEGDFKNLHPSPFGQALYARSIVRLLSAAWSEPQSSQRSVRALPEPLDEHSYDAGALFPIDRAQLVRGFLRIDSWRPEDRAGTRRGFVAVPILSAEEPGAELTFSFEGRAVGLLVAAGPDAGTIEFQVDASPPEQVDLFTRWSAGLHLPWAYVLAPELEPGLHDLTLRVLAARNEKSRGHAVRIVHLLVNGPCAERRGPVLEGR